MYKEELICDLAETYHIYNMYDFTPEYIGILVNGLDADSRVNRKIGEQKIKSETYLLAGIFDNVNYLLYGMSDPKKRGNPPDSILKRLLSDEPREKEKVFVTPDDFRETWKKIVGAKHG